MNLNTAILSGAAQTTGVALDVIQSIARQQMENFELQKQLGKSETTLSCSLGSAIRDSEMDESYNMLAGGIAGIAGSGFQLGAETYSLTRSSTFTKQTELTKLSNHQEVVQNIPKNEQGKSVVKSADSHADQLDNAIRTRLRNVNPAKDELTEDKKAQLNTDLTAARDTDRTEFDSFAKRVDDQHTKLSKERDRADDDLNRTRASASGIGSAVSGILNAVGQITGSVAFKKDQADKDLEKQYTQAVFEMTRRMNDQASQSNNTLQSTKDSMINQVLSNRAEVAA